MKILPTFRTALHVEALEMGTIGTRNQQKFKILNSFKLLEHDQRNSNFQDPQLTHPTAYHEEKLSKGRAIATYFLEVRPPCWNGQAHCVSRGGSLIQEEVWPSNKIREIYKCANFLPLKVSSTICDTCFEELLITKKVKPEIRERTF